MELFRALGFMEGSARNGNAAMEKLIFVCPKTKQQVDIGVTTEIGTLLRIRSRIVRAQCPACGETHEWPVRDAWLVQAA
jgi:predicted RNA-binding Zn-ribbon protein involved in translation (DUF1610 family)